MFALLALGSPLGQPGVTSEAEHLSICTSSMEGQLSTGRKGIQRVIFSQTVEWREVQCLPPSHRLLL